MIYINAENLVSENSTPPTLSQVKTQVLVENKRYLIDFSNIEHETEKNITRAKLRRSLGLLTLGDMVIISEHKGKLLFSQLESSDDTNLKRLEYKPKSRRVKKSISPLAEVDNSIPRVAFYIEAKRTISDAACNPTWNTYQGPVKSTGMCDNAHISLIYQVTLQRSLPFETQGSATPDAKIVRIAIDDSTTGAGIQLNQNFDNILLHTRGIPWPEGGDEHETVSYTHLTLPTTKQV